MTWPWYAQMSAMPGMWVQSAVCADVARCGSGMSGMWPRGSRNLLLPSPRPTAKTRNISTQQQCRTSLHGGDNNGLVRRLQGLFPLPKLTIADCRSHATQSAAVIEIDPENVSTV